uniref:Repressor of RNA polymerase III transcription n=1 Tax=Noctiluca scintillans TaxID=2966 RepID=A0A7S1F621_NOCSC|mmetsp:Transcript_36993/g.98554  ORF Transcript_36993/g.98554 Transcript_36993/m.98554 type:complete len:249 (+) Transcript_36993:122-868(+)
MSMSRVPTAEGVSFLTHPQLAQLSSVMKAIDAGDRIIKGRLELFSYKSRRMPRRQQEDLHRRDPCSFTDSPLGPLLTSDAQSLMVALISLLGLLFPDHDCTRVTPHDFQLCSDKHAVVNSINHNLAAVVDRTRTGFMMELWIAVQDAIDLGNCEIYALQPRPGTFEPAENSLMSLHYFFVDQNHGRVLFIGGVTKSRGNAGCGNTSSDSEVALSEDAASNSSKSMGSSLQEGEYCFDAEGSDDDAMVD